MKILRLCLLLMFSMSAFAQTSIPLNTPHTVALNPVVATVGCSAWGVTTFGYATVVTGFSTNGSYVTGQVSAYFTCGHNGRTSTTHTVYSCVQLSWDLSGNLVSATDTIAYNSLGVPVSSYCPSVTLSAFPSTVPPSSSVIANSFTNAGGYTAETILYEACGTIACYAMYDYPTLLTP
jgi:hypothetical protein